MNVIVKVSFVSSKLRTGCDNSNLLLAYTAIIKKRRKSHKRKLTSDRNELMYNFLLVLRELIANRFCFIARKFSRLNCLWESTRNLTSRIRRRWKYSHGVLFVSEEW